MSVAPLENDPALSVRRAAVPLAATDHTAVLADPERISRADVTPLGNVNWTHVGVPLNVAVEWKLTMQVLPM